MVAFNVSEYSSFIVMHCNTYTDIDTYIQVGCSTQLQRSFFSTTRNQDPCSLQKMLKSWFGDPLLHIQKKLTLGGKDTDASMLAGHIGAAATRLGPPTGIASLEKPPPTTEKQNP